MLSYLLSVKSLLLILESIQLKLSSDYRLNIYFSRRFPYIDGPSFSPYKPFLGIVLTYGQELLEKVWGYVSHHNSK